MILLKTEFCIYCYKVVRLIIQADNFVSSEINKMNAKNTSDLF